MSEQEPFDAGDEVQVGKRKTKAKLQREREVYELQQILSTEGGRMIMFNILSMCHLYDDPPFDADVLPRFVGYQDVGRKILLEIFTADPNAYILMQKESEDRRINKEKEDDNRR